MKIFIISGSSSDGSAYLEEIVRAQGLCFCQRSPLQAALKTASPQEDLLLLPRGSTVEGVKGFLDQGGNVVAIQPRVELDAFAGLVSAAHSEGRMRLRFVEPVMLRKGSRSGRMEHLVSMRFPRKRRSWVIFFRKRVFGALVRQREILHNEERNLVGLASTSGFPGFDDIYLTAIPEPGTASLVLLGLAGFLLRRRCR